MLVDHANCEKKAASTAIALMFAYPEDHALAMALSRLAREELRHFEQVQKMMLTLGVEFRASAAGSLRLGSAVGHPDFRAGPEVGSVVVGRVD